MEQSEKELYVVATNFLKMKMNNFSCLANKELNTLLDDFNGKIYRLLDEFSLNQLYAPIDETVSSIAWEIGKDKFGFPEDIFNLDIRHRTHLKARSFMLMSTYEICKVSINKAAARFNLKLGTAVSMVQRHKEFMNYPRDSFERMYGVHYSKFILEIIKELDGWNELTACFDMAFLNELKQIHTKNANKYVAAESLAKTKQ